MYKTALHTTTEIAHELWKLRDSQDRLADLLPDVDLGRLDSLICEVSAILEARKANQR